MSDPAPLLRLPLELRQHIYAYLLPPSTTSHPLPSVGITAVSHAPPTSALLNIHPQLTDEILSFYYTITTWKLIFSHAFNFFRVDPQLKALARCAALGRMRKVELVFYCDILLVKDIYRHGAKSPNGRVVQMEEEVRRKAARAVEVLMEARELKTVIVSWIDTTGIAMQGQEADQAVILSPLRALRDKVVFKVGRVVSSTELSRNDIDGRGERAAFVSALRAVVEEERQGNCPSSEQGPHNRTSGLDGTTGSASSWADSNPATLRLLAFDSRQDRGLFGAAVQSGEGLTQSTRRVLTCKAIPETHALCPVPDIY